MDRRLVLALAALLAIVLTGGGVAVGALLLGDRPPADQGFGPPPDGRPAGPPPTPPPGDPGAGPPAVGLNQDSGDGDSTPVLSGSHLPPNSEVTIALRGQRAEVPMRTDRMGTFHYTFNQAHEFFSGSVPPGTYVLVVRYPGGQELTATYRSHP